MNCTCCLHYTVFYTTDVKHFELQSLYEMCYTNKVIIIDICQLTNKSM